MSKRVVITGVGVKAGIGRNRDEFLKGLLEGACGTADLQRFDTTEYPFRRGSEIREWDPAEHGIAHLKDEDICNQLMVAAAKEAMDDSALLQSGIDPFRVGVSIATSLGGIHSREQYHRSLQREGRERPELLLNVPTALTTTAVCKEFGLSGPAMTIVTACAAGTNAIGAALDMIRSGRVVAAVTGGVDPYSGVPFSGFNCLNSLSEDTCRPFNEDRDGLTLGEGAGALILEDYDFAVARGARIYAEISGYGISNDAYHATSPHPDGDGAVRAMEWALADAGITAADVDYVNAHGTGTLHNDRTELRAITRVFGDRLAQVAISSSKSQFGHTLGAAGAVEAVVCVLAITHGFVPATVNFRKPVAGYEHLDFVPNQSRPAQLRYVLSNSFGFAGNTASVVFKRYEPTEQDLSLRR